MGVHTGAAREVDDHLHGWSLLLMGDSEVRRVGLPLGVDRGP
jgi:hypothetical protein